MPTWERRLAGAIVALTGVLASVATSPPPEDRCETDTAVQRCVDGCEELAALLREPLTPPGTTTGQCVRVEGRVGCGCFVDDERDREALDGDDLTAPDDVFIDDGGCSVFGRLGECLFDPADFPGCTLPVDQGGVVDDEGSEANCTAVCAAVDERRRAAAAARPGATLEPLCDLECACRIRDGGTCVIAFGAEQLTEGISPEEANAQLAFNTCPVGGP